MVVIAFLKQTLYYIVVFLEATFKYVKIGAKKFLGLKFRTKALIVVLILLFFDTLRGWLFGFIVWLLLKTI